MTSGRLSGSQEERMPCQRTVLGHVTPSREHCNHQGRLNHKPTGGQLGSKGHKQVQGLWKVDVQGRVVRMKGTCWEQNPLHCEAWRRARPVLCKKGPALSRNQTSCPKQHRWQRTEMGISGKAQGPSLRSICWTLDQKQRRD